MPQCRIFFVSQEKQTPANAIIETEFQKIHQGFSWEVLNFNGCIDKYLLTKLAYSKIQIRIFTYFWKLVIKPGFGGYKSFPKTSEIHRICMAHIIWISKLTSPKNQWLITWAMSCCSSVSPTGIFTLQHWQLLILLTV